MKRLGLPAPTSRPGPARRRGTIAVCALAAGLALAPACGKKGPPLAPLLHLPAAVDGFGARRLGSTVYLQFTVPNRNQDASTPADIARVDVYGFTGTPESNDEMVKYGTLVASVPVRRPPSPDEEEDRARGAQPPGQEQAGKEQKATPRRKAVEPEPGFDQGGAVTVTEALTPALLQPANPPRTRRETKKQAVSEGPVLLPSASVVPLPSRVYVAVGVNHKGQRGVFSPHAGVPVFDPPAPPLDVIPSHTEKAITIGWTPPPGAPVPKDSPAAATTKGELPPLPATRLLPLGGPEWSYQVYEVPAPSAGAPPAMPPVAAPQPLNEKPLSALAFNDPKIEFGTPRCYVVRTVKSFGSLREESEPSEPACITPRDVYPPATPRGLTAVVNAGAIGLIWDPNAEEDLDGYLVLRADAPGATLQPITREPIHQTTFNDASIKPGVRYVYAIVAVDKAGNASPPSARIEETAR